MSTSNDHQFDSPQDDDRDGSGIAPRSPGTLEDVSKAAVGLWLAGAEASLRTGFRLARRLPGSDVGFKLAETAAAQLREQAKRALGVSELEEQVKQIGVSSSSSRSSRRSDDLAVALRERGARLLRESSDVGFPDDAHPAYARILRELAPDEARILRLLFLRGPQAAVDVRSRPKLGSRSELIRANMTIIGAEAGCRHVVRVPSYLAHLVRDGLIVFRSSELEDLRAYQVLEAQPYVTEALLDGGRGSRTIRRTVALSDLGTDFCKVCLPVEPHGITTEFDAV